MSTKRKALFIALLVVIAFLLGRVFLNSPLAHIEFAAETIFPKVLGVLDITNSLIAAWVTMALLISVAFLATRNMKMVPTSRLQNLAEGAVGWLLGIVESIAGKAKGRRFFPLVATIFFFILIANWSALIPVFGTIGKVETIEKVVEHHAESAAEVLHLDSLQHGHRPPEAVVRLVRHDAGDTKLAIFNGEGDSLKAIPIGYGVVKEIRLDEAWDFEKWEPRHGVVRSNGKEVDLTGKTPGVLVPYLRSMNTDLNNTLAFGLIAMVMIQIWAIKSVGFFNYAGRYINFKEGPIGVFVGILEAFSEVAKLISFTFRLLGNMFAGEVVLFAFLFLTPLVVVIIPLGLEVFVGFIQAVVFAALTLVLATLATESHGGHEEKHEGAPAGH